uniref:2,3-bisphosphoglycerate-independent phosphoglycerate mutase n=1 Tax=Lygus hesperus TaxID=30085 RepID=A0A0A9W8A9_LYGHE
MSISVGELVFLIVPGFLYVDCNLLMDDPPMGGAMILDTQLQTTRPPHRIFFIESGNRVERVVDDEFMPMPPPLMNPGFPPPFFGGRETSVPQNHTSPMDHASREFNSYKGDGSKFPIQDLRILRISPVCY